MPAPGASLNSVTLNGPVATSATGSTGTATAASGAGALNGPPGPPAGGNNSNGGGGTGGGGTAGGALGEDSPALVTAVVDYLNLMLAADLGAGAGTGGATGSTPRPKVFADAAPPFGAIGSFPYIIVHDTDEHYEFDSNATLTAKGHLYFAIKANGKAQAHRIGLRIVQELTDADLAIDADPFPATLLYLRPMSGSSHPLVEQAPGPGGPVATERTIGFQYVIRYALG